MMPSFLLHTLSGDKVSPKKGTNFLWAPAYSPEPPQSSGVLHLVLRDSFLRQPIRFKETFQQPMRIKQSVGILAITWSKNKHSVGSGHICSDSRCTPFDTRLLLFFSHVVFMLHVA